MKCYNKLTFLSYFVPFLQIKIQQLIVNELFTGVSVYQSLQ